MWPPVPLAGSRAYSSSGRGHFTNSSTENCCSSCPPTSFCLLSIGSYSHNTKEGKYKHFWPRKAFFFGLDGIFVTKWHFVNWPKIKTKNVINMPFSDLLAEKLYSANICLHFSNLHCIIVRMKEKMSVPHYFLLKENFFPSSAVVENLSD